MARLISMQDLKKEYSNAYDVADANVRSGELMKSLGVVFGFVIGLPFPFIGQQLGGQTNLLIGVAVGGVLGLIVGVILNRIGTVIAAQGELLRAVLDIAVNTSPLLVENRSTSTVAGAVVHSELG